MTSKLTWPQEFIQIHLLCRKLPCILKVSFYHLVWTHLKFWRCFENKKFWDTIFSQYSLFLPIFQTVFKKENGKNFLFYVILISTGINSKTVKKVAKKVQIRFFEDIFLKKNWFCHNKTVLSTIFNFQGFVSLVTAF